jgi:hypothetical protein
VGRHQLDEGATGRRVDQLEDFVASLQDALDALNAKVDEAVAAAQGRTQAVEDRIAAELSSITTRLHDGIVSLSTYPAPEAPQENLEGVALAQAPNPSAEPPASAGWRPGQPSAS